MPTEAASARGPFHLAADGLRVDLRVQPGARREGVEGPVVLDDGRVVLKLRVRAPPEGGRANAATIRLLAKSWKLPKSALAVVAGQTARRKTLMVTGDPGALKARLEGWLAELAAR